jgi:predicted sugar kinase
VTIKTPLGGSGHGFERLTRGGMRVDTGFRGKRDCARISPITMGDNFQSDWVREFITTHVHFSRSRYFFSFISIPLLCVLG